MKDQVQRITLYFSSLRSWILTHYLWVSLGVLGLFCITAAITYHNNIGLCDNSQLICPNSARVSRQWPSCKFEKCPTSQPSPPSPTPYTVNLRTLNDANSGLILRYPPDFVSSQTRNGYVLEKPFDYPHEGAVIVPAIEITFIKNTYASEKVYIDELLASCEPSMNCWYDPNSQVLIGNYAFQEFRGPSYVVDSNCYLTSIPDKSYFVQFCERALEKSYPGITKSILASIEFGAWKTLENSTYGYLVRYPPSVKVLEYKNGVQAFEHRVELINGSHSIVTLDVVGHYPKSTAQRSAESMHSNSSSTKWMRSGTYTEKINTVSIGGTEGYSFSAIKKPPAENSEETWQDIYFIQNNGYVFRIITDYKAEELSVVNDILASIRIDGNNGPSPSPSLWTSREGSSQNVGNWEGDGAFYGYIKSFEKSGDLYFAQVDFVQILGDYDSEGNLTFEGSRACVEDGQCTKYDASCEIDTNGNCIPSEWSICDGNKCKETECGVDKSCLPNGFYERNQSKKLRKLEVPQDARITILDFDDLVTSKLISTESFERMKNSQIGERFYLMQNGPYELEIANGKLIRLSQQYRP